MGTRSRLLVGWLVCSAHNENGVKKTHFHAKSGRSLGCPIQNLRETKMTDHDNINKEGDELTCGYTYICMCIKT